MNYYGWRLNSGTLSCPAGVSRSGTSNGDKTLKPDIYSHTYSNTYIYAN